ncbi:iron-containing alcohol dehydrogenase [Pelagibius marinus]|uniref:iron-containing alcohol dehydrogenase n=1 Tax=Pelagibius marinus TaxID=2762760 RepID=UPI001872DBE3|nr:iron-containing alcohol dehydrogenase [Pelagibius marinus]
MTATPVPFSLNAVPEIHFGPGRSRALADDVQAVAPGADKVLLVVDAALVELGVVAPIVQDLEASGATVGLYADIAGEPKAAQIDAAAEAARRLGAGAVVALGGGSALDIGKVAAAIAPAGEAALHYALAAQPLPAGGLPAICLPTTAGTGSELSATNIFTGPKGKKLWIWGQETKPRRVVLDPELTLSLPPQLTAWTGLDAFVHALEACTNRRANPGNSPTCHKALALVAGALETAVTQPGNLEARGAMLLGSAFAGIGIDNCGTAVAHNISHALAGLAPVHHGLATALGLEATLAWSVEADAQEADGGSFAAAARACGLKSAEELPAWYSDLMTRCGVARRLPEAFRSFDNAALAAEMRAAENRPMRLASAREVTEADIDRFSGAIMALA